MYEAPAGVLVEVGLPDDHPQLPVGAPLYCSSSQEVKRRYRHSRPKPGLYRVRRDIAIDVELNETTMTVTGRVLPRRDGEAPLEVRQVHQGPFVPAREAGTMAEAARTPSTNGVTPSCHRGTGRFTMRNGVLCRFLGSIRLAATWLPLWNMLFPRPGWRK